MHMHVLTQSWNLWRLSLYPGRPVHVPACECNFCSRTFFPREQQCSQGMKMVAGKEDASTRRVLRRTLGAIFSTHRNRRQRCLMVKRHLMHRLLNSERHSLYGHLTYYYSLLLISGTPFSTNMRKLKSKIPDTHTQSHFKGLNEINLRFH